MTTPKTHGIGFRVTTPEADAIRWGHRNLNHGAQTACELYPYIRHYVIRELYGMLSHEQIRILAELELPVPCDRDTLAAIASVRDASLSGKLSTLTESQVVVIADLIAQNMLLDPLRGG